ncbi:MAG: ribose 5-phosphate isomerase A [Bacteroidetes bacterium]|nr:ribose 5-phosphate isomerase A [Bacteroidota bacterium]
MDFKKQAAAKAITLVKNQSTVGLGAGSTIAYMVDFLKIEIKKGLDIKLTTSSFNTKQLLLHHEIPVMDMKTISSVDICFDGCDQFDQDLHALKSTGGIHTQEKLLASMAKEFILIGDDSKYAEKLDTKFSILIELLPEATSFVAAKIKELFPGVRTTQRMDEQKKEPLITWNKNYLLDIWFNAWPELSTINPLLKTITGVVETSLFYNLAKKAIVAGSAGTSIIERA